MSPLSQFGMNPDRCTQRRNLRCGLVSATASSTTKISHCVSASNGKSVGATLWQFFRALHDS